MPFKNEKFEILNRGSLFNFLKNKKSEKKKKKIGHNFFKNEGILKIISPKIIIFVQLDQLYNKYFYVLEYFFFLTHIPIFQKNRTFFSKSYFAILVTNKE